MPFKLNTIVGRNDKMRKKKRKTEAQDLARLVGCLLSRVQSLAPHKQSVVANSSNPTTYRLVARIQKFKVILDNTASPQPALAAWDLTST